jgi:hypothetical protein
MRQGFAANLVRQRYLGDCADDEHGGSTMACQFFQWLVATEGPSTLQHGLVGIGCLLTYDLFGRWRKSRRQLQTSAAGEVTPEQILADHEREEQRRAA